MSTLRSHLFFFFVKSVWEVLRTEGLVNISVECMKLEVRVKKDITLQSSLNKSFAVCNYDLIIWVMTISTFSSDQFYLHKLGQGFILKDLVYNNKSSLKVIDRFCELMYNEINFTID